MGAIFGSAGTGDSFTAMGYKHSVDAPAYIKNLGLDCFEYQCGRGLKIKQQTAEAVGEAAARENIALSLHAPYYISLSSVEEEKRDNSIGYILSSAQIAKWMGATRVILHPGSCAKLKREEALELSKTTLSKALTALDEKGLGDITLCPETMGRLNLLGDLGEIIELCKIDDRLIPCIDFGHLNARSFGGLKTKADFAAILDEIENGLGRKRLENMHVHFTKIEFSLTAGEVRHLTNANTDFGPEFKPLGELIAERGLSPVIICESDGTQPEDALEMKKIYNEANRTLTQK